MHTTAVLRHTLTVQTDTSALLQRVGVVTCGTSAQLQRQSIVAVGTRAVLQRTPTLNTPTTAVLAAAGTLSLGTDALLARATEVATGTDAALVVQSTRECAGSGVLLATAHGLHIGMRSVLPSLSVEAVLIEGSQVADVELTLELVLDSYLTISLVGFDE
jgi:hypothetical protein